MKFILWKSEKHELVDAKNITPGFRMVGESSNLLSRVNFSCGPAGSIVFVLVEMNGMDFTLLPFSNGDLWEDFSLTFS